MKKMDLGWGDGTHSALLDIKKGCLRRYVDDEVEQIHRDYGGENYYRSRSRIPLPQETVSREPGASPRNISPAEKV